MLPKCSDHPAICCQRDAGFHPVAQRLLDIAQLATLECVGEPLCGGFDFMITHGEPVGSGDYVAVWLSQVLPTISQQRSAATSLLVTSIRQTYGISVCQEGYPGPKTGPGGEISAVPPAEEYNHVAPYDYALVEAIYFAVLNAITTREVAGCAFAEITSLRAESPQNYSARWRFDVTVSV